MSLSDARKSLEIYTRDFAKKHGLKVSYENVEAKHKGEYLECFVLSIEPSMETFLTENHQYIFQVNFYLNENESAKRMDELVDEFRGPLSVGYKINSSAIIYKPTARSGSFRSEGSMTTISMKSGGKYMTAVSIYFQFSKAI